MRIFPRLLTKLYQKFAILKRVRIISFRLTAKNSTAEWHGAVLNISGGNISSAFGTYRVLRRKTYRKFRKEFISTNIVISQKIVYEFSHNLIKFSKNLFSMESPVWKDCSGCHWVAKTFFSLHSTASIIPSGEVATTSRQGASFSISHS